MGDCVDPGKENNGERHQLVEGNVLIELNYAVQRRLSQQ